jgi:hypothetical protein
MTMNGFRLLASGFQPEKSAVSIRRFVQCNNAAHIKIFAESLKL